MSGLINQTPSGGGGGGGPSTDFVIKPYTAGVAVRDVVYLMASNTVDKADATSSLTMPAIGVVVAIDNPVVGDCKVQVNGDILGFSGLTPGKVHIVSKDPGKLLWEGDTGSVFYPSLTGNVSQQVGVAGSPSLLTVDIQDQIEV